MESVMRIGTLAYATQQGLGYLARSFYRAGVVTDTLVVNHPHRRNMGQLWYPDCPQINLTSFSQEKATLEKFCNQVDVMLFFETPFFWELIDYCRSRGIKTVLMPMYECLPPKSKLPYQPDQFICPSLLDLQYYPDANSKYIPVPADPEIEWKQRDKARVFIHNAGNGGLKGRNGTRELVEAIKYIKSPINLIIRSQVKLGYDIHDLRVTFDYAGYPHHNLYHYGDVFVFPETFNGLSLPLQEAYAAGMCVMATNRFPNNMWLPNQPLIPVRNYDRDRVSPRCVEFDRAIIHPKDIASTIDAYYDTDISSFSSSGKAWAEMNSWEKLKPEYLDYLASSY